MIMCEYTHREQQAQALATLVAEQLRAALALQGFARLALSGGTSPQAFLSALNVQTLPWEAVRLTLVDERQVEQDSPRSNLRFVRECLPIAMAKAELVPLYHGNGTDLAEVARTLHERLFPLDVCVLGMGEDGHFASLFPAADNVQQALDPATTAVLLPIQAPGIPEARVSLTLPVILSARHLHLLIQGESKRHVLYEAQQTNSQLPVACLLANAGDRLTVHYAD